MQTYNLTWRGLPGLDFLSHRFLSGFSPEECAFGEGAHVGNPKQHVAAFPISRNCCFHRLPQDRGSHLVRGVLASTCFAPGYHRKIQVDSLGLVLPLGLGLLPHPTVGAGLLCPQHGLLNFDQEVFGLLEGGLAELPSRVLLVRCGHF